MSHLSVASSPSSQPQQANSPPDVQHGVIRSRLWPIEMVGGSPVTVLKFYFLDGAESQKKAVLTTILKSARNDAKEEYEEKAGNGSGARGRSGSESPPSKKCRTDNPFDFVTWEDCANIQFEETKTIADASIRITFRGNGFDTAIGTEAQNYPQNSMMLAGLGDTYPPSPPHRRNILHEFGHALGLDHEHQGPAARKMLRLRKTLIKQERGAKYAKDNILEEVEDDEDLWNYTNFDTKSIMTYPIEDRWQKQKKKITIDFVLELSDVDQACIKLMYPPDLTKPENREPFMKALDTVRVDKETAGKMIDDFTENSEGSMADRLTKLRDRFNKWNSGLSLYDPNVGILRGIDPASLRRSGIHPFVGEVTKNKLFQSILKNIVHRTMVQHGIPTKGLIPGATQTQVTKLIAALSMHDDVGQLVRQHSVAFSGTRLYEREDNHN